LWLKTPNLSKSIPFHLKIISNKLSKKGLGRLQSNRQGEKENKRGKKERKEKKKKKN
jgi:hypothetical protein